MAQILVIFMRFIDRRWLRWGKYTDRKEEVAKRSAPRSTFYDHWYFLIEKKYIEYSQKEKHLGPAA